MELNWSTFSLEIINFLVLVWILKRFLYRPVLDLIARRKAGIDKSVAEAQDLRREAQSLQEQYEHRFAEWEREKEKARARLRDDLEAERARLQARLLASLEEEREKARALEEHRAADLERRNEEAALAYAATFAARLLSRVAGPELEGRLVDLVVEELAGLTPEKRQALRDSLSETKRSPAVTSAYPLGEKQRAELAQALAQFLGRQITCEFGEDRRLLAGLRIAMGAWVLKANLQDELKFFAEAATHGN